MEIHGIVHGKLPAKMAMINSYVRNYQRVWETPAKNRCYNHGLTGVPGRLKLGHGILHLTDVGWTNSQIV